MHVDTCTCKHPYDKTGVFGNVLQALRHGPFLFPFVSGLWRLWPCCWGDPGVLSVGLSVTLAASPQSPETEVLFWGSHGLQWA